jgi:hypothetical protein
VNLSHPQAEALWFAMDLTPLVADPGLDIRAFVLAHVDDFRREVEAGLLSFTPNPS